MPRAMSRPMLPLGTTPTSLLSACPSLSRMMEPLPYSFSMVATASSIAFVRFLSSIGTLLLNRTYTAWVFRRQAFLGPVLGLAILLVGCAKERPVPTATRVTAPAPEAGADADEPPLPAVPAGDLAAEIDHFTTVDACVSERAHLDPL